MKSVVLRDLKHTVLGRLFQARMWREYTQAWDGKPTPTGIGRKWVETFLGISRSECLRRARINVRLAHRLNRRAAMKTGAP